MRVCSTGPFLKLCWFPPSFYSNDIPQGTITTYYIQLAGDDTVYDTTTCTDTCYEFVNVSLCDTFSVSVTASVGEYNSSAVVIPIDSELFYD